MRKRPWGVVSVVATALVMNVVFVGCGDDSAAPAPDGGTSSSSGTASGSSGTSSGDGSSGSTSSGGSSGSTSSGGSSGTSGTDGSTDANVDATTDATTTDAAVEASDEDAGVTPDSGTPVDGGPTCTVSGGACAASSECCSGTCVSNQCAPDTCKTDTPPQACSFNAECCSGKCGAAGAGPTCLPLGGATSCRIEGNTCAGNDECCSKQCVGGTCVNASFCTQTGDVCAADFECCGGRCTKQGTDAFGRCTVVGTTSCQPAGTVCTGQGCDNKCCSLSCGPHGTSGVNICQPPSGCKPQDELCSNSSDCCGGPGQLTGQAANGNPNAPLQCIVPAGQTLGRCEGPQCLRPGAVCKAPEGACGGTSNNCCESLQPDGSPTPNGTCNSKPELCCSRDALGIPRCRGVNFDCSVTGPPPAGSTCATSADCCGKPCVNNKCEDTCVPMGGNCSTSADCCSGIECVTPTGSTQGICGGTIEVDGGVTEDAGTPPQDAATCSLFGQACTVAADCCNNVPCSGNICRFN